MLVATLVVMVVATIHAMVHAREVVMLLVKWVADLHHINFNVMFKFFSNYESTSN